MHPVVYPWDTPGTRESPVDRTSRAWSWDCQGSPETRAWSQLRPARVDEWSTIRFEVNQMANQRRYSARASVRIRFVNPSFDFPTTCTRTRGLESCWTLDRPSSSWSRKRHLERRMSAEKEGKLIESVGLSVIYNSDHSDDSDIDYKLPVD